MEQTKKNIPSAVIYIIAWILFTLLLLGDVLLVREATLDVMTVVQEKRVENAPEGEKTPVRQKAGFVKEAVDRGLLIVGGLAAVTLSLFIEHYLRKGLNEGLLRKRIMRVAMYLIAVMAISVGIQTLV